MDIAALSVPGIIGASVGLLLGLVDFQILRALIQKRMQGSGKTVPPAAYKVIMALVFVSTVGLFPLIGYWFGTSFSG